MIEVQSNRPTLLWGYYWTIRDALGAMHCPLCGGGMILFIASAIIS